MVGVRGEVPLFPVQATAVSAITPRMITAFRRYSETWVVRGFFLIMVLAFMLWGVGDVVRLIGTSTWVAKVGGETIEGAQLQQAYQRGMAQATRNLPQGQEPTQPMRDAVARQALQGLIAQAALDQELRRLRIVAPDAAVRQAVFAMPAFHGADGQFDQQTFETVLRSNGLTEPRFLDIMRTDLAQKQLIDAVTAGAAAPPGLVNPLYEGQFEKRSADMVEFPSCRRAAAASTDGGGTASVVRQPPGLLLRTGIPQNQGSRPVA